MRPVMERVNSLDLVPRPPQMVAKAWKAILALHKDVEFVWLQFVPLHGNLRVRMIPVDHFSRMIEAGERVSIAMGVTHVLPNDHLAKGGQSAGAINMVPDLSTAYVLSHSDRSRLQILAGFALQDGSPAPECGRQKLISMTSKLLERHKVYILVGYEIEVVFMKHGELDVEYPDSNHSWSAMTSDVQSMLPMVEDIVRTLAKAGISFQQFHAESAPGQWEFVLSPQQPLEAVDTLFRARSSICTIAREYGYRATLHPRPYPDHAGTGAHIHLSVNPSNPGDEKKTEPFFAGIINHLPSLMAFCLPLDVSYERVATGIWSGGEYVSWGWQNRETPLRRIAQNRFEVKLHCGTANPYASLASVLAAGILGLERGTDGPLVAGDCQNAPGEMTEEQRSELGVTTKLPRSVEESIGNLVADTALRHELGEAFVSAYVAVTQDWNQHIQSMEPRARRRWLLQNY
jgi:glutamine synthetase